MYSTKKIFLLILMTITFSSVSIYADDVQQLFRKDSVLSDQNCDDATKHSSRVFFYISLIKEEYNSLCKLENIKCDDSTEVIKKLRANLEKLENQALSFEVNVIKKDCIFDEDKKRD